MTRLLRTLLQRLGVMCLTLILIISVTGCSSKGSWDNSPKVLVPSADESIITGNSFLRIDISNTKDGYLTAAYTGTASKVKFFITTPDKIKYTYDIGTTDTNTVLPLTGGNGTYSITVMECVKDNLYSTLYEEEMMVSIDNQFSPFLYPNQYTWFTKESAAVIKASQLTEGATDAIDAIGKVYTYVTTNITYDEAKAASVTTGYLPDVDSTLATGKGICFDYAALMTAMLRSQGIPTKLEIGYSGDVYHAWISAYTEEKGWMNSIIEFDGKSWALIDPTLASSNSSSSVKKYVGNGSNYTVKYSR